jgi:hypothetical protein
LARFCPSAVRCCTSAARRGFKSRSAEENSTR